MTSVSTGQSTGHTQHTVAHLHSRTIVNFTGKLDLYTPDPNYVFTEDRIAKDSIS